MVFCVFLWLSSLGNSQPGIWEKKHRRMALNENWKESHKCFSSFGEDKLLPFYFLFTCPCCCFLGSFMCYVTHSKRFDGVGWGLNQWCQLRIHHTMSNLEFSKVDVETGNLVTCLWPNPRSYSIQPSSTLKKPAQSISSNKRSPRHEKLNIIDRHKLSWKWCGFMCVQEVKKKFDLRCFLVVSDS